MAALNEFGVVESLPAFSGHSHYDAMNFQNCEAVTNCSGKTKKKPPPVPVKTAVLNPRVQGGAARSGLCEPNDAETSCGYTRSQTELTPNEIIIVGSTHWSRIEHCRGSRDSEESQD